MTTVTSRAAAIEDAFLAQLKARDGLQNVQVEIGPLGDQSAKAEYIQLGVGEGASVSVQQTWGALGNRRRDETGTIRGEIYVQKPGAGPGVIRLARDRATALLKEVEAQLRDDPHVNELARVTAMMAYDHDRGFGPGLRYSIIHFSIEYEATLPRT